MKNWKILFASIFVWLGLFSIPMNEREIVYAEEIVEEDTVWVSLNYTNFDSLSFSMPRDGYVELCTDIASIKVGFSKEDENDSFYINEDETRIDLKKGDYKLYLFDGFGPSLFEREGTFVTYKIYVPEERSLGEDEFYYKGLRYHIIDEEKCEVVGGLTEKITIPNEAMGYQVTSISAEAFKDNENINSIFVSKSIAKIETSAFKNCWNLELVTFEKGSSLTIIGQEAFSGCYYLESIGIPKKVKSIGYAAFGDCVNLQKVTFKEGSMISVIDEKAFRNCSNLKKIVIACDTLPKIEKNAFAKINKKAVFLVQSQNIAKMKKCLSSKKTGYLKSMKIRNLRSKK